MLAEFWKKYGRFAFLGIGVGLIILGLLISFWEVNKKSSAGDIEFISPSQLSPALKKTIVVHIAGAVNYPGVYDLPYESRFNQVIQKAGGMTLQADTQWITKNFNLARKVRDGEKIYIPKKGETSPSKAKPIRRAGNFQTAENNVLGESQNLVNLNLATQAELETLPGIGPAMAQRIIDYREKFNGFRDSAEIKAVSGIGEKTFEKLKEKISI